MKKLISWILALSLILCAVILPAVAEEETQTDTVTSASVSRNGKDGRNNAPGGQPQGAPSRNGQMPGGRTRDRNNRQQAPAEVPGSVTPPEMPDGMAGEASVTTPETAESGEQAENADSAAAPESGKSKENKNKENKNNTRSGKKGKADGTEAAPRITFELLLEKGVISREVYDAIMDFIRNYTAENAPAAPALPAEAEGAGT